MLSAPATPEEVQVVYDGISKRGKTSRSLPAGGYAGKAYTGSLGRLEDEAIGRESSKQDAAMKKLAAAFAGNEAKVIELLKKQQQKNSQ